MLQTPLPHLPWEKIGADLCSFKGENYLVVVDYFSRFIEIAHLEKDTTAKEVIKSLKLSFARHGIPTVL